MRKARLFQLATFLICTSWVSMVHQVFAQDDDWIMTELDMYANETVRYIGIGTTIPQSKLHLSGHFTLENSNRIIFKNANGGDDGTYISRAGGNTLRFWYNGAPVIFKAVGNHEFIVRNADNQTVFAVNPSSVAGYKVYVHDDEFPAFLLTGGVSSEYQGELAVATANGYYSQFATTGDTVLRSLTGDLLLDAEGAAVRIGTGSPCQEKVTITSDGRVGIGKTNPNYKLDVNGTIRANEILVNTTGADFVFADTYALLPIETLSQFISQHKHLPDIPSASDMQRNGASIGELHTKLLQKIEELTLYIIAQNEWLNQMEQKNEELLQIITHSGSER